MRLFWSALALLAGVFQAATAMALEFSQRGNAITVSGPIKPGDNVAFEEFMAQPDRSDIKIFHLNSNGGTIGVALDIARSIRKRGGTTVVDARNSCESACTVIFAGGRNRHYINANNLQDRLGGARGGLGYHEGNNSNSDGRGRQYSGGASQAMNNAYYELGSGGAGQFMVKAGFRDMYRISGPTALSSGLATSLSPP
jgi:hypothetical protein